MRQAVLTHVLSASPEVRRYPSFSRAPEMCELVDVADEFGLRVTWLCVAREKFEGNGGKCAVAFARVCLALCAMIRDLEMCMLARKRRRSRSRRDALGEETLAVIASRQRPVNDHRPDDPCPR